MYNTLLNTYPALNPFRVREDKPARLPATTAAAKKPRFSKPFCCAPLRRVKRSFVWGLLVGELREKWEERGEKVRVWRWGKGGEVEQDRKGSLVKKGSIEETYGLVNSLILC